MRLGLPIFSSCLAKRQCPGSRDPTTFVDESSKFGRWEPVNVRRSSLLPTRAATRPRTSQTSSRVNSKEQPRGAIERDDSPPSPYRSTPDSEDVSVLAATTTPNEEPFHLQNPPSLLSHIARIVSPQAEQVQLLHLFSETVAPSGEFYFSKAHRHHSRLLHYISEVSSNTLLDCSIRAVTLAQLGRSEPSPTAAALVCYGKALRLLASTLQDKVAGLSDETLAATILLSWYETLSSDTSTLWIKHAGGVSVLLKMRGPARHRTGFGRELFLTYRPNLVVQAMGAKEACLLDDPAWRGLTSQIQEDLAAAGLTEENQFFYTDAEEFWSELARFPALVRDARRMRAKTVGEATSESRALAVRVRAFQACFEKSFRACQAALKETGFEYTVDSAAGPLFPLACQYASQYVASIDTTYASVTLITESLLRGLEQGKKLIAESKLEERFNKDIPPKSVNPHGLKFAQKIIAG